MIKLDTFNISYKNYKMNKWNSITNGKFDKLPIWILENFKTIIGNDIKIDKEKIFNAIASRVLAAIENTFVVFKKADFSKAKFSDEEIEPIKFLIYRTIERIVMKKEFIINGKRESFTFGNVSYQSDPTFINLSRDIFDPDIFQSLKNIFAKWDVKSYWEYDDGTLVKATDEEVAIEMLKREEI